MGFKNQSVFTTTYTNTTFTVTEGMGIESITINLVSGSATLLGGLQFPGLTLSSVALSVGQPVVLNVNSGYTLTDITVDSTAGGVFQVYTIYAYNNALDPSAAAYLAATGITGPVQSAAIDTLVKSLKATNLWSNMKAIYPFVTDNRNLLSYTEDFGNAAWSKDDITVTANTTTAPNGTLTAETMADTATNFVHGFNQSITPTSTGLMFGSVYLKNNGRRFAAVIITTGASASTRYSAVVDLETGTITQNNSVGSPTNTSSFIESVGDGWYRISVGLTCTTTAVFCNYLQVFTCNTGTPTTFLSGTNAPQYIGNGSSNFVWGAQLELGSTSTTYQPISTTQQAYISNQFKYNLVNPVDSDAAFRLVFNGGWTFSTNGALPNGTNGYADTRLNANTNLTVSNFHLSFYTRTNNTATAFSNEIGLNTTYTASGWLALRTNNKTTGLAGASFGDDITEFVSASSTTAGFMVATETSSSLRKVFKNNSLLGQNTTTSSTAFLSANVSLSGPGSYSTNQAAFTSIGNGLTDEQSYNLGRIVYAYETALSRQVGVPIVSDPDAQAFINAADITDLTQANAINNLVIGLKADGLWTKMKAIYPFVGGTASTHKWNLKDPRDLDAAYRLVFNGGWTHSANGATPNGTNGYADTKLTASANLNLTNTHLSFYSRTNSADANARVDMGRGAGVAGTYMNLFTKLDSTTNAIGSTFGSKNLSAVNSNAACYAISSAISSTSFKLYRNGTIVDTNTAVSSGSIASTSQIYIGSQGNVLGPTEYSNRQCAFATIGDGLTDTEAANLYTQVQTYQTALSRQV